MEKPMAVLPKNESREELRRRLIEEAEENRRKQPVPPQKELLAEIRRRRLSHPRNPAAPDSTILLREDRER
jgi:hypothetical protein